MGWLLLFKTLHIIGFVSWFAGLFYLVRLFVYHVEAFELDEPTRSVLTRQYHLMERRLYGIITQPAMWLTWVAGLSMVAWHGTAWLASNAWLHVKLLLVVLLTAYHLSCRRLIQQLAHGRRPLSSYGLRLYNEVPTLLLTAIVALAVFRQHVHPALFLAVLGLLGFVVWYFARKRTAVIQDDN